METMQMICRVICHQLVDHKHAYVVCTHVKSVQGASFPSLQLLTRHELPKASILVNANKCHVRPARFVKWSSSLTRILIT